MSHAISRSQHPLLSNRSPAQKRRSIPAFAKVLRFPTPGVGLTRPVDPHQTVLCRRNCPNRVWQAIVHLSGGILEDFQLHVYRASDKTEAVVRGCGEIFLCSLPKETPWGDMRQALTQLATEILESHDGDWMFLPVERSDGPAVALLEMSHCA